MHRTINGREAPLPDRGVDGIFVVEDIPGEPQRIHGGEL